MIKTLGGPKPAGASEPTTAAPAASDTTFASLGLIEPILRAVKEQGYDHPTPIQAAAVPHVIAGRDLLGCAQTGTGKTAAFALPILQRLALGDGRGKGIRALVLTPTRELALQIDESFRDYGRHLRLKTALIFGGVGAEPQKKALAAKPDILVATPGRLLDLMGQGHVDFSHLEIFVLDEADRMLDMGFINDVRKVIAKLPKERQNLLFSATMPPEIQDIAARILKDPARVEVARVSSTNEQISQAVYFVDRGNKRRLLLHVLNDPSVKRALVFTRTKAIANRVSKYCTDAGVVAEAIHGNKSQNARQRALANFKSGETRVLVASDLAARGIDIDEVSHVINYDLPNIAETYVHRIGRTGRARATGIALSFCDSEERPFLAGIEKLIRKKVPVIDAHPFPPGTGGGDAPEERSAFGGRGRQGGRPQQGQRGGDGRGHGGGRPGGGESRGGGQRSGGGESRGGQRSGGGDGRAATGARPHGGATRPAAPLYSTTPRAQGGDDRPAQAGGAPGGGGKKRRRRRGGRGGGGGAPQGG